MGRSEAAKTCRVPWEWKGVRVMGLVPMVTAFRLARAHEAASVGGACTAGVPSSLIAADAATAASTRL